MYQIPGVWGRAIVLHSPPPNLDVPAAKQHDSSEGARKGLHHCSCSLFVAISCDDRNGALQKLLTVHNNAMTISVEYGTCVADV